MLVSKNAKICITPNANTKICITPNANPQHEQEEYRSRWQCRFHVVCAHLISVGYPTQTQFVVEYGLMHFSSCVRSESAKEFVLVALQVPFFFFSFFFFFYRFDDHILRK